MFEWGFLPGFQERRVGKEPKGADSLDFGSLVCCLWIFSHQHSSPGSLILLRAGDLPSLDSSPTCDQPWWVAQHLPFLHAFATPSALLQQCPVFSLLAARPSCPSKMSKECKEICTACPWSPKNQDFCSTSAVAGDMRPHFDPLSCLSSFVWLGVTVFHIFNEEEISLFSILLVPFVGFREEREEEICLYHHLKLGDPSLS